MATYYTVSITRITYSKKRVLTKCIQRITCQFISTVIRIHKIMISSKNSICNTSNTISHYPVQWFRDIIDPVRNTVSKDKYDDYHKDRDKSPNSSFALVLLIFIKSKSKYNPAKKPACRMERQAGFSQNIPLRRLKEQAAKSPDVIAERSDDPEPERHAWVDEQVAAQVIMKIALDDRFEHVEDDGQEGREWFALVRQPGYCLRYDWSDLYGNQPGTLQLVKAGGPTGEKVPVIEAYRLEEGDDAGLGAVLDRACSDAARDCTRA